jgi:hypothetical protein
VISEGVDIRRLRVLVYATNVLMELAFRQVTGRLVRTDSANDDDWGLVVLPADPTLLAMSERILEEVPAARRAPLVVRDIDPRDVGIRGSSGTGKFVPLGSTGQLGLIRDTDGRAAPAQLVAAATRYVESSGSPIPPFELALAAANDEVLRAKLLSF